MAESDREPERKPPANLDPSAGGHARAQKLTPEERSEIARRAAEARWDILAATHTGTIRLAGQEIACAVLEDGRRVLSQQSFLKTIGRPGSPKSSQRSHDGAFFEVPVFLQANNLKPFIGSNLTSSSRPICYKVVGGGRAYGYEARLLPLVCDVYLAARSAGVLTHRQIHVAEACELLVRALAQVGIVALVDEATGYQEVRDRQALQAILDKYLRQEFAAWAKRFPDDFYKEIFRLRGWEWRGMKINRPQCVANYTKDLVYARLAPGVLEELETRNPKDEKGNRKAKHHQWLTDDIGHPALAQHLYGIIGLMRSADSWDQLMRRADRAYPKRGSCVQLELFTDDYD